MAAGLGLEPRRAAPKTAVLPLDDPARGSRVYRRLLESRRAGRPYTLGMARTLAGSRIARLSEALQSGGADAYLAWSPVSMMYLHGYGEQAGERFLTLAISASGEHRLICPALSESQARRAGIENVVSWRDGEDPLEAFRALADDWNLRSAILAVDADMPAALLLQMQAALPAALFKSGQEILGELMRRKDAEEIGKMRRAADIADRALQFGLNAIKAGVTERQVADALTAAMSQLGGLPTFAIVGTGSNSAEPHHLTDDTAIQEGDVVVMDFGCTVDGYHSDITRMATCGEPVGEAKRVYEVVLKAHQAARAAIRPGISGADIDLAAREVIESAGFGEFFVHRTGHGIGMRVHEEPYIVSTNAEPLQVGDCFSIEPGIYLPGRFGVRIENIVTVTDQGHESLNEEPGAELPRAG